MLFPTSRFQEGYVAYGGSQISLNWPIFKGNIYLSGPLFTEYLLKLFSIRTLTYLENDDK